MSALAANQREEIRRAAVEAAKRSAAAQGLPLKITDPTTIKAVAAIMRGATEAQEAA